MPSIASKTILDELVIEAKRNSRGGCTVYAVLPVGREVFIADVNVLGPKRALIEAQKNPLVVRELVKLTTEAKKIRAQNERMQRIADEYGDDEEIALYIGEQNEDAELLAAARELGIDLSPVRPDFEGEYADECDAPDGNFVIESDPYVTA